MVGCGRLSSEIGGWWEVNSEKWWEAGPANRWEMGGWPRKQVGDGRLAPKTGGRMEVETPATPPQKSVLRERLVASYGGSRMTRIMT